MQHQTEARVQHLMDLMVWELNLQSMERLGRLYLPRFVALKLYELFKVLLDNGRDIVKMYTLYVLCTHTHTHTMRQEDVDTAEVALPSPGYTQESQQDSKIGVGQGI